MRISLNWLSEYIPVPFTPEVLSDRLTMLGLEIEAIERIGDAWDKVVVGEVLEVMPHPNADKLQITKVSIGNNEPLSIVCGAPNVRVGQRVAVATLGADLGGGMVIKKAKIRGEASEGMICSERELGVSQNHEGIWELPSDAPIGLPLADALGMRDTILEVGITPNRADCLSHIGIAREIRAITGEQVQMPKVSMAAKGGAIAKQVRVTLPQPELCPRYVAKLVRGVTIASSPDWLKRRLEAVGLRPINNVVDVTNFVLMECGHPLHAFDFDVVENGQIEVRTAGGFADEFVTLDGKSRKMPKDALLITDGKKPLGIAGIMGGENSEIRDTTRNVLIESAYFNPTSIRRTAKQLGLSSDASYRFERGADFNILEYAAERAAQMIVELAGGEVVEGVLDECAILLQNKQMRFRPERANALLGMAIPLSRMMEVFSLLNIEVQNSAAAAEWSLKAPSYRIDLEREEDAIEEVARIVGYEDIPTSTFERTPLTGLREPLKLRDFDSLIRTTLLSLGANECVSIPLVSAKNALQFHDHPVELINPLNMERDRMRTSIAINLLESARVSERFGADGQRLFEIGNVFHYSDTPELLGHVSQSTELGILISGIQEPKSAYNGEAIHADIFLMKGMVEALLRRLGILEIEFTSENLLPVTFIDPAQSLSLTSGKNPIGLIGRVTPEVAKAYDLRKDAWIALFDHATLYDLTRKLKENPSPVRSLPKYPSVERDIAIVLGDAISAKQVEDTIRAIARPEILRRIQLFDQFQSKEMRSAHERSLAFHLVFRSDDRTLEEHEVDALMDLIIKRLEGELHARLRV
jgi:phenylalanyl-tRNA synthetase beta chain